MLRNFEAQATILDRDAENLLAKARLIARNTKDGMSLYGTPAQKAQQRQQYLESILALVIGIDYEVDTRLRYVLHPDGKVGFEFLAPDGERWQDSETLTHVDFSVMYYHTEGVNPATLLQDIAEHILDAESAAYVYVGRCGRDHNHPIWSWVGADGKYRSIYLDTVAARTTYANRRRTA
jgi:hypothetical protein